MAHTGSVQAAVILCNRSATYMHLKKAVAALADAQARGIDRESRTYPRLGSAHTLDRDSTCFESVLIRLKRVPISASRHVSRRPPSRCVASSSSQLDEAGSLCFELHSIQPDPHSPPAAARNG
eukprot:5238039-Pleurochrysis_carterae.AAC.1